MTIDVTILDKQLSLLDLVLRAQHLTAEDQEQIDGLRALLGAIRTEAETGPVAILRFVRTRTRSEWTH
jgi:hypothetical protein